MRFITWIASVAVAWSGDDPPALVVGELARGEVTAATPIVRTDALDARGEAAPVRGVAHLVEAPAGASVVELRSYLSDAYLVVRDAGGNVLAEDDDGLIATHSRVVVRLPAAARLRIEACALHGETGPFELRVVPGEPATLDEAALAELELREARREIAARDAASLPDDERMRLALDAAGFRLWERGDHEDALACYERMLPLCVRQFGEAGIDVAIAENNIAAQLTPLGRHAEALPHLERALAIHLAQQGPAPLVVANASRLLADCLVELGRAGDAIAPLRRTLAIRAAELGATHTLTISALTRLRNAAWAANRDAEVVPDLERAVAAFERVSPLDDVGEVDLAHLVGHCVRTYLDLGQLEEARHLLARFSLRPVRDLPEVAAERRDLRRLEVATLQRMGRADEAAELLEPLAASIEAELPDGVVATAELCSVTRDLASVRISQRRLDEALRIALREVELTRTVHGDRSRQLGESLCGLGILHQRRGEIDAANRAFEESLALLAPHRDRAPLPFAKAAKEAAFVARERGDRERARTLGRQALTELERLQGRDHIDVLELLETLAMTELADGAAPAATTLARELVERSRALALTRSARATQSDLAQVVTRLERAVRCRLRVAYASGGLAAVAECWSDVVTMKGLTRRVLAARGAGRVAPDDPRQRERLARLEQIRSELSAAFAPGTYDDPRFDADALERRLARLRDERLVLESEVAAAVAEQVAQLPPAATIAAGLPKEGVLLDLLQVPLVSLEHGTERTGVVADGVELPVEWRTFAWIVHETGGVVAVDLGSTEALVHALFAVLDASHVQRGAAPAARDVDARRAAMARLRARLWDPLSTAVGAAQHVLICPDGALALLPFGIIELADGRVLLERFALSEVDDPASLAARRASAPVPEAASLLAVGAVDYDEAVAADGEAGADAPTDETAPRGSFARTWMPLSETRREVDGIARHHRARHRAAPRTVLMEGEATEERLVAELPRHAVIHLATHGYFLAEGARSLAEALDDGRAAGRSQQRIEADFPSVLCGLVCAGVNARPHGAANGLLTGEEIGGLDLSRCDLAVLSACDTARGRAQAAGQGAMSLARAFRDAGARTVISSLWRVRDDSTRELMVDFYDRLWNKGERKVDALRNAQLAMLQKNRAKYGDTLPATWGAFVLTGEWE